jgi:hypothetical protein
MVSLRAYLPNWEEARHLICRFSAVAARNNGENSMPLTLLSKMPNILEFPMPAKHSLSRGYVARPQSLPFPAYADIQNIGITKIWIALWRPHLSGPSHRMN